jgi:hypothetical protein
MQYDLTTIAHFNNKGAALPLVLIFSLVFLISGATFLEYHVSGAKLVSNNLQSMQAYYIARAGAIATATYMVQNPAAAGDLIGKETTSATALGQGIIDKVKVYYKDPSQQNQPNGIIVESTGTVGSFSKKVILTLTKSETGFRLYYDMALFSLTTIKLIEGAMIKGNVGTNLATSECVSFDGGSKINGKLTFGPGGDPQKCITIPRDSDIDDHILGGYAELSSTRSYPLPDFPEYPTDLPMADGTQINNGKLTVDYRNYTIDSNGYYPLISIIEGGVLTIYVGSDIRKIRVGNLDIQQGFINLEGTGKLILYVDDNFALKGSSTINHNGSIGALTMYYNGSNTVNPTGGTKMKGSIYVRNAPIVISEGGGVLGNIITGGNSVEISGGATAEVKAIYAPNAYVKLIDGGFLYGACIANSFYANGGTSIVYDSRVNDDSFSTGIGEGVRYSMGMWQ